MYRKALAIGLAALALAGCGDTKEDRAITGGGIGAAAGAVVGAVTGLSVLQGALIGAGAGALTGALTDKSQVNIGDPVYRQQASASQGGAAAPASALGDVRSIQQGLARLGYEPGPADGVMGPRTRDAVRRYQADRKLLVDGNPSPELAQHLSDEVQRLDQDARSNR